MKRQTYPRLRASLALAFGMSAAACTDALPDNTRAPNDDRESALQRESRPSVELPAADGAFLRVTGVDGATPRVDADGKLRAEVRVGRAAALRTLGLDVTIDGAEVLEWERDDTFLRSTGGKLVALESRLDGDTLSVVLGTTEPVSTSSADGERVLSLVLSPTGDDIRISVAVNGDMRGLLDASGARLEVLTDDALIARAGE